MNRTSNKSTTQPPIKLSEPGETPKQAANFWISQNAYSILLRNNASSCAICTYLVIAKYADNVGEQSTVGQYLIKQRLGVGQRLVAEAIDWLISHNLIEKGPDNHLSLYKVIAERGDSGFSFRWKLTESSSDPSGKIWFSDNIVGESEDNIRPLKELKRCDIAARLLLFLTRHYDTYQFCVNPTECHMKFSVIKDSSNGPANPFNSSFNIIQTMQTQHIYAKNDVVFRKSYDEAMKILEKKGFIFRRIVVIGNQADQHDTLLYELDVKSIKNHIPRDEFMLAEDMDNMASLIGFNTARLGIGGKKRFFNKYAAVGPLSSKIRICTVFDLTYFGHYPVISTLTRKYMRQRQANEGRRYLRELQQAPITTPDLIEI